MPSPSTMPRPTTIAVPPTGEPAREVVPRAPLRRAASPRPRARATSRALPATQPNRGVPARRASHAARTAFDAGTLSQTRSADSITGRGSVRCAA